MNSIEHLISIHICGGQFSFLSLAVPPNQNRMPRAQWLVLYFVLDTQGSVEGDGRLWSGAIAACLPRLTSIA